MLKYQQERGVTVAIKRVIIVVVGLLLQILILLFTYLYLADHLAIINATYKIVSFGLVLGLMRNNKRYSYYLP